MCGLALSVLIHVTTTLVLSCMFKCVAPLFELGDMVNRQDDAACEGAECMDTAGAENNVISAE